MKDYIKAEKNEERRFYSTPVEVREDELGDSIEGVAAVVNKRTDLGFFEEEILPGAFDDVLKDDVRALFNHDPNYPLARTKSGTLKLSLNKTGDLVYRFDTPNRQYAKDLTDAIKSGDVSQSSFAFRVSEENWVYAEERDQKDLRQIKKIERLFDVSPVTYPAYQDTTVAKRSMEESKPIDTLTESRKRRIQINKKKLELNS